MKREGNFFLVCGRDRRGGRFVTTTGNRFDGWIFEWIQVGSFLGRAPRVVPRLEERSSHKQERLRSVLLFLFKTTNKKYEPAKRKTSRAKSRLGNATFRSVLMINSIKLSSSLSIKDKRTSLREKQKRPCFSYGDVTQHASPSVYELPCRLS